MLRTEYEEPGGILKPVQMKQFTAEPSVGTHAFGVNRKQGDSKRYIASISFFLIETI